ncbi:TonB-dependent receptor domain-containing protein [Silvibacterium sp.]|uniref:TonB-dependent receptor domain-containing protein n=1 Tax=Silvibacterium sp. TaxID=1964179 RepID=UPI0039E32471
MNRALISRFKLHIHPGLKAFGIFLLFLATLLPLQAQDYRGTIAGQVTDQSGAVIPKAIITAVGPQQTYHVISQGDGNFNIPFVELGNYAVSAEAPGFGKVTKDNIQIDVTSKVNLNFSLKPGAAPETVTVSSNAVGLNTEDASGGTVMDPEKIQNLPLNGRQVYMLLSLTPGTKFTTTTFGPSGNSGTRGWDESNAYSINGQSGNYNQFTLNGAPVSTQGGGGAGTWNIAPNVDAVEEFKVMTNTYDAQYGRVGGGTVNTALKSGGDHFHGTLFEFWRNSVLEANYWQYSQQGESRPFHNQNQFGGTFGGPLYRGKAYFFGSFEGWREVLPAPVTVTTLTSDMFPDTSGSINLNGYIQAMNLNGIYDPLTTTCSQYDSQGGCETYSRQQFAGNIIPANRISPIGLAIMKVFPSANRSGYTNNYVSADPGRYQYNQPIGRIDYNFSDRTRMYGMFAWWSGTEYRNGSGLPGAAAQGDINNYRSSLTQVIDVTHTFSPTLVWDTRVSFNRAYSVDPDGTVAAGLDSLTAADLGLNMPSIPTTTHKYAPEIDMDDCCIANVIGNEANPTVFETYSLSSSLTHTLGKHNLHYGVDLMLFHDIPTGIGQPNGVFSFGAGFTQQNPKQSNSDGAAIADLILGYPESGSVQDYESVYEAYNDEAAYIQDDWKVKPHLTLNLGLRFERETSPRERNDRLNAGFCLTCVNPVGSEINGSGIVLPNGEAFPSTIYGGPQFASSKLSAYSNQFGEFEPKFGFSYALSPNLVMRGGYGLGQSLGIELGAESTWEETTGFTESLDNDLTPSGYFNSGTPYPNGYVVPEGNSLGLSTGLGTGMTYDQRDRKVPIVEQYSFGFQGSAPLQSVWDLEYVGAHTYHLRAGRYMDSISESDFDKGHADHAYLDTEINNPYYGVLDPSTSVGSTSQRIARDFIAPFSEYAYLYDYAVPQGYTLYDSLIAKLEKRFTDGPSLTRGLSILASFTWSKTETATGRLNNSAKSLVDDKPYKAIDSTDRPWQFAFSGLYNLPIGRGGAIFTDANRYVQEAIGGWQLDWIFQNAGGTPVGFPNTSAFSCGNYNIVEQHRSYKSYINNTQSSCFSSFPEYTKITELPRTTAVRAPYAQQTQLGLEKKFPIYRDYTLQFKAEAFNATNTPIFGGPSTSSPNTAVTRNTSVANPNQPGAWSGYGTIGSTEQNFPRQIQLSLKLLF